MEKGLARIRRTLAAALVAGVLVCSVHPVSADQGLRLEAQAGLGGLGRPGRWVPVRIQIDNADRDLSGELLVEWGDARLHRAVDIAAPSRSEVEVYVRTTDVRGSMAVSLISHGERIAGAAVPIRMAADDQPLTVCVGGAVLESNAQACTVIVPPETLPRSMRGYDAADEVRWEAGPQLLIPEQRAALRRWRAYHAVESQNLLSLAPRALWNGTADAAIPRSIALAVAVEMATLVVACWLWARSRGPALRAYATLAGAVVVGTTVSMAAGRGGPGSTVIVRHASTVQQVADGSLVSMRGTIEYPAYDNYAVRVESADGALTRRRGTRSEQWSDSGGRPVLRGVQGRGYGEEVDVEAAVASAPFAVTSLGTTVRVTNVSGATLTDCRFPDGFSRAEVGTLAPDDSTEARAVRPVEDPFFVCTSAVVPLTFSDDRFPVRTQGKTLVYVPLPMQAATENQQ